MRTVNWGILSTGWIANEFCAALQTVPEATVCAVASRTAESAKAFAERHAIPRHYDSYEALANDPDIDIVYIGSPNGLHCEHALLCLHAGKHVLCEKPLGTRAEEAARMAQAAKAQKRFLMEAMWTRFFPALQQAKAWYDEGRIGTLQLLRADCPAMETDESKWLWDPAMHGGCLNDVGIYTVSLASWFFGEEPGAVSSSVVKSGRGVDVYASIGLAYARGIASLSCALPLTTDGSAYLCGERGYIHIPTFNCAKEAILHVHGESPVRFYDDYEGNGYQYEASAVTHCILDGCTESSVMPLEESIAIRRTMDRVQNEWRHA